MRTDRRVHPAGHVERRGADGFRIQVGAHAMQALELEGAARIRSAAGHVVHRGDGLRVVRGEHRIQRVRGVEHAPRTGEVTHVGVGFAGEHRIAGEAFGLRLLDLRVPVRTLDQPHGDAAADAARQVGDEVDHERRALLVGLHGQPIALPAGERGIGIGRRDHVQRQVEPLALLGVDGEADALRLGERGEHDDLRHQLGQHAGALVELVARMQRRQFHRDRRRGKHVRIGAARADGQDRQAIGLEVARCIGGREGALAQHVEGIAVGRVLALARAFQRLADAAAHHELMAHDAHRLAHGQADRRLADPADQAAECATDITPGLVCQVHQAAGQHQAPGRGVDQR